MVYLHITLLRRHSLLEFQLSSNVTLFKVSSTHVLVRKIFLNDHAEGDNVNLKRHDITNMCKKYQCQDC